MIARAPRSPWSAGVSGDWILRVEIETPNCIHDGDVDFNGILTAGDAQIAFEIALELYTPTVEEECAADCDASGTVTAGDAQTIFLGALGMDSCVDPI